MTPLTLPGAETSLRRSGPDQRRCGRCANTGRDHNHGTYGNVVGLRTQGLAASFQCALALFRDEKVGCVQTPQHFFNPDPLQHGFGVYGSRVLLSHSVSTPQGARPRIPPAVGPWRRPTVTF